MRPPEPSLVTLLDALGDVAAAPTIAAYVARGPDSVGEFLAAWLVENRLTTARGRSRRAIEGDAHACLMALAAAYPRVLVQEVGARPATLRRTSVVSAVATVLPNADAAALLFAALRHRDGNVRWHALYALVSRGHADVAPLLARLLRDRDGAVRATAVEGLRRLGRGDDVAELVAYTARVVRHERDAVLDAIEAICARAARPLPAVHPGARLEVLVLRGRVTIDVPRSACVSAGDPLGTVDGAALLAPCDGVVAAVDHEPDRVRVFVRRLAR